jgi:hypothetical protein
MNLRGKPGNTSNTGNAGNPVKKNAPSINSRLHTARQRVDDLRALVGQIAVPPQRQRTMGYAEAIRWLVANRPADENASRAAVLRAPRRDGAIEISFIYLNAKGGIASGQDGRPYGRTFIVDEIDEELADAFGDTPLLIVS